MRFGLTLRSSIICNTSAVGKMRVHTSQSCKASDLAKMCIVLLPVVKYTWLLFSFANLPAKFAASTSSTTICNLSYSGNGTSLRSKRTNGIPTAFAAS